MTKHCDIQKDNHLSIRASEPLYYIYRWDSFCLFLFIFQCLTTCFFLKFFSWFVLRLLWIVLFFGSHPLDSSLPLFSSYLLFGSCPLFGYLPFFVSHYLFSFLPIYASLPLWFLSSLWFCSTLVPFLFGPHPLFGSLERVLACTCKLWDLFPAGPEFACLVSQSSDQLSHQGNRSRL